MKRFSFDIDILGACNLRCPSCPQGNFKGYRLPHGYMEPEVLARILGKASSECSVAGVGLFNWAEPMLHPRLPELVRIVRDAGLNCYLSSNLNILRNADAVMAADPFSFRISASGFTREVYGYYHRGGDIERVKKHMVELAGAKKRNNASSRIYVYYHRYRDNLKDEPLMREFAAGLGIGFEPVWALFFPLEKLLACAEEDPSGLTLTDEDRRLIDLLALPLQEALDVSMKHGDQACSLRDEQISMDFQGNVQLCCGVFDPEKFTLGNYLAMPLDEIQRLRHNHGLCGRCMRRGIHVYMTFTHVHAVRGAEELDAAAVANIPQEYSGLLDLPYELAQKRLRRRLEKMYQKFFAGFITTGQKAALGTLFDRVQRLAGWARRSLKK